MEKIQKREGNETRSLGALGVHLLLELRGCDPDLLKDSGAVKRIMAFVAKKAKVAIADVSFRTWPKHCYAAVDIFTYGYSDAVNSQTATDYVVKRFRSKNHSVLEIKIGLLQTQ